MRNEPSCDASVPPHAVPFSESDIPEPVSGRIALRHRARRRFRHWIARQFMLLLLAMLAVARRAGRRPRRVCSGPCEILLTGRFDSKNWILNHLGPLAASERCSRVWMVSSRPVPALPKVTPIYPPRGLVKILGATPARLLTFAWVALRKRPHVVGGFHLIPNGIASVLMGCLTGARSVYFSVGGKTEVIDGGVHSETPFLRRMETPDAVVQERLLSFVSGSDLVVTMGTRAVEFFQNAGVDTMFGVVSGGIDSQRFSVAEESPHYDLILTGRLAEIKRVDIFLHAVQHVARVIPDVKAVIVGDGDLRNSLQSLATTLGIARNVEFAGYRDDIENWLHKSRIFVLTSDSEGLSLSMMEAMMCGLPAVVSDVGDLGDLVEHGVNGYLVPRRSPERFAESLVALLSNEQRLQAFSRAARRKALQFETQATVQRWNNILAGLLQP
jgi:L-malate glycosyltransferase